jgi:carbonic anhydrase
MLRFIAICMDKRIYTENTQKQGDGEAHVIDIWVVGEEQEEALMMT